MDQPTAGWTRVRARAILCGERIDVRAVERTRLAALPHAVPAGEGGIAVLERYGVVVLFNMQPVEEAAFLRYLAPLVTDPTPRTEIEELELCRHAEREERIEGGELVVRDFSLERLQLVAEVLAKSVVVAYYEAGIATLFDRIEPLAAQLQTGKSASRQAKELLEHIGATLATQQRMVGRVEVEEKPDLLWERPDLERFYLRLTEEYELRDRSRALERKLELIHRTAGTLLDLLQTQRSLRVEWYIVILIVLELALNLYQMFTRH